LDQPYPFGLIHLFNSQSPNRVHQSDDWAQKEEVCQDSRHKLFWPMKFLPLHWAISTQSSRGGTANTLNNPS
jgi:hypothetical protein